MVNPTVADYLKYANLQMAAEAFIRNPQTGELSPTGQPLIDALVAGNKHASRFTPTEAAKFADPGEGWTVLDQEANTRTGFSGTLFKNNKTDELVISFRSTEFIDDAVHDNVATNVQEINKTGWAWGQIVDMEKWYGKLQARQDFAGQRYSVTGYSLGGHLATAFALLRRDDNSIGRIDQVITFNGAGVGKVKSGSLTDALTEFRQLRDDPDLIAASFTNPALRNLYLGLRTTNFQTREQVASAQRAVDSLYALAIELPPEAKRLRAALVEIDDLLAESDRLKAIHKGGSGTDAGTSPRELPLADLEARSLDYRLAVGLMAQRTEAASYLGGVWRTVVKKEVLAPQLANEYEVVSDTSLSMVANSQWHYGSDVRVAIEDQPEYRGTAIRDAASTSWDYKDPKLLVDGYAVNDFGDTHSLVLLIDSLSVMQTLRGIDATHDLGSLATLLKTAGNSKVNSEYGTQGKAEGDTLEALVDALHQLFVGTDPQLRKTEALKDGGTWAIEGLRNRFFEVLAAITDTPLYKSLAALGTGHIVSFAGKGADELKSLAQGSGEDAIAYRYALKEGNPFAVVGFDYRGKNNNHQLDLYDPATGVGDMTERYLADRAAFVGSLLKYNTQNLAYEQRLIDQTLASNRSYEDKARQLNLSVIPSAVPFLPNPTTQKIAFGADAADTFVGGEDKDAVYGGAGMDRLDGGKVAGYTGTLPIFGRKAA